MDNNAPILIVWSLVFWASYRWELCVLTVIGSCVDTSVDFLAYLVFHIETFMHVLNVPLKLSLVSCLHCGAYVALRVLCCTTLSTLYPTAIPVILELTRSTKVLVQVVSNGG